ncbi:MAG: MFS transporter, partial [Anaerolineae bacterium]|nr:MFS transporter [Anaerolineae bacterium]
AMGLTRLAVPLASLVGVPAAVAMADRASARASFATVGGMSLAMLVAALVLLPRLLGASLQADRGAATVRRPGIAAAIRQPSVAPALLVIAVWAMVPTGVFIYLAAWLEQAFRFSQIEVGLAFSTIGLGALLGDGLAAAWADSLGKKRSAMLGLLVMSVTALLLPHVPAAVAALAGVVFFTTALEFGIAGFGTLLTELAPEGRGTLLSLVSLANGLGTGLVPLALRPLWERGGYGAITPVLGALSLAALGIVGLAVREQDASLATAG